MPQRNYLMTGATGKTASARFVIFLKDGHAVRAFVHQEDERSAALRNEGAEIVVGDLLEHDDLKREMAGVRGAYLCYPVRRAIPRPPRILQTPRSAQASKSSWNVADFCPERLEESCRARSLGAGLGPAVLFCHWGLPRHVAESVS